MSSRWEQIKNSSLVAEKRTDPEQIQSLIDKPYYVDQIKYKID
jgi:hypothetical protein